MFPSGSVFTWNHWGISNSALEYGQPERFWPERFINDEHDMALKGHLGFGAGELAGFLALLGGNDYGLTVPP